MIPDDGHYDSWHDDVVEHRLIGMSVNLSTKVYMGGAFQLRSRSSGLILYEVTNTGSGDCIVFRIDPHLEHRVATVEATASKTAFAGWFQAQPEFLSLLTKGSSERQ
jgi:hypothetical protein